MHQREPHEFVPSQYFQQNGKNEIKFYDELDLIKDKRILEAFSPKVVILKDAPVSQREFAIAERERIQVISKNVLEEAKMKFQNFPWL